MDTIQSIYGKYLQEMKRVMQDILARVDMFRKETERQTGMDPVEHCLSRIKSEESMREKCRRNGLPENTESALHVLTDAIGIRIVCAFLGDVYKAAEYLRSFPDFKVIAEKDYIRNVKPNGYRSYHIILKTDDGYFAEVQIRTISMDTWAALEHHLKYKKDIGSNVELIKMELKRCADELASTDVSMQAIRDMIMKERGKK